MIIRYLTRRLIGAVRRHIRAGRTETRQDGPNTPTPAQSLTTPKLGPHGTELETP